jgi:hypothetical protein
MTMPQQQTDTAFLQVMVDAESKEMKETDLLLAFAWVLPSGRRHFDLFPFVFHVDAVASTNNKKRPLLTVCGRDNTGKMFTVLRAFLPNECAWMYR